MNNNNNHAPIDNVSDTAFWVAVYRAKESERELAMFNDPFAHGLAGERGRQMAAAMPDISPYVEWSVVSRTVIIDRFIERLIGEDVDAVINLGAGLDARPYRMSLPATLEWIEADHPSIIAHKNLGLASAEPRCKLTRVGIDLGDDPRRMEFLQNAAPQARKVLVLTEGVLPYLSPEQVSALGRDLSSQRRFTYWITEYFHPRTYRYLNHPVRAAKMKNAPFRFFPDDWYAFFKAIGWVERETRYTSEIATEFNRKIPMPTVARLLMPFLPKKAKEELLRMTGFVVFETEGVS
jgi:methyltransferase (TIGR00027 family)